jgi:hypothetical protein
VRAAVGQSGAAHLAVPAHDSKSFTMDAKSFLPSPSALLAL